jgi:2-octaprenyl-6-methoxyphenol hydroxylase
MTEHPEVLIVGAGPLGLALALMLTRAGLNPTLVDARPETAKDSPERVLALSEGSRQILESLSAWPAETTPIRAIHVSQQGGFGRTRLEADTYHLPALGYVTTAQSLTSRLRQACKQQGLAIEYNLSITRTTLSQDGRHMLAQTSNQRELTTHLVVHAEGKVSPQAPHTRVDYQQDALVCTATPSRPHSGLAFERFTPQGPLALLPYHQDFSVVLTVPRDEAKHWLELSDQAFISAIEDAIGDRVQFKSIGARSHYPLSLCYRDEVIAPRTVWLGNAAQTLHPVAGQGFNLALRDAFELCAVLADSEKDIGSPPHLERYARQRKPDRRGMIFMTDALVRLFSNPNRFLKTARGLGLMALDLTPWAKGCLAHQMMMGLRGF